MPVGPVPTPAGKDEKYPLEVGSGDFSSSLAEALTRNFAQVTLLDPPEGDGPITDKQWVAAARAAGADLMLECSMRYDEQFTGTYNDKFWLNLPLFLLGGPACWFVRDRTYSSDAELIGEFFDLSLVYRDLYELGSGRVRLMSVNADFDRVSMNFVQRAGGHVPSYLFSLIIPAGLLAQSNKRVKNSMEGKIVGELSKEFRSRVADRGRDFVRADGLVNFWFEPPRKGHSAVRVDDETVLIRGKVVLRIDEEVRRMSGWRISSGAEAETLRPWEPFGQAVTTTRSFPSGDVEFLEYPLEATFHLSQGVAGDREPRGIDTVRLELEDGHENRHTRRYTFPVHEGEEPAP